MAYKITSECIKCGTCASVCPVAAITEGDDQYIIDEATCVECGTCQANCPVSAIEAP